MKNKLIISWLITLLTYMLIGCNTAAKIHKVDTTGKVVYVKKVMVADKHHGFRSMRVDYIVDAGGGSYYVNGRKMKLVAFDSTNKKNFKPTKVIVKK